MPADSRRREVVPLLVLAVVLAGAYWSFFAQYAFDDSYVGYGIAQSLLQGRGFSFNGTDRFLSTSAPLAAPIYALLALPLHGDVVLAAQILAALALAVIAFGSYALARKVCAPAGALAGAVTLTCGPFILLLWSHETLLFAAAVIGGLLLYVRGRFAGAALVLGCASLLRGEALLVLPFVWAHDARARGRRPALVFAALSLAPFAVWCAIAFPFFGSAFSATIASKRAQLRYPEIAPYLDGLRDYVTRMYALTPTRLWGVLLETTALVSLTAGAVCGLFTRTYLRIVLWAAAVTALYVVLRMPFYFWFCAQLAVLMAVAVAMQWPAARTPRFPLVNALGRTAALVLVAINAGFLVLQLVQPERKMSSYDWVVMPSIHGNNAYRELGLHFAQLRYVAASIAYPEIGEIHYYSDGIPIVDYLGIATPGAVSALAAGNPIWTFKRYVPHAVVTTSNFQYFVDPLEYDWFWRAYRTLRRPEQFNFKGDPTRSRFTVYRLSDRSAVPPPDVPVAPQAVLGVHRLPAGVSFTFVPPAATLSEIEARVAIPPGCSKLWVELSGARSAQRELRRELHGAVMRLTLSPRLVLQQAPYALSVTGCRGLAAAPPLRLRDGFIILGKPAPQPGDPADALRLYWEQSAP